MNKAIMVVVMLASMTALGQTLPVITSSPNNTTIYPGQTATFNVSATGATSYQWLCNGTNIPGATGATLQVSNAQSTNCGYYLVLVQNSTGWVPSQMAYLSLDYTYGGTQPTACGTLTFSTVSNTNYPEGEGDVEANNGTVSLVVGPQLDEMQPVGLLVHYRSTPVQPYFYNGYVKAADQSDPNILPGQIIYYSMVVTYTNYSTYVQPSTIMEITAGTNGIRAPSNYGLKFPGWWAGEGIVEPVIDFESPTNLLRVLGESFSFTNAWEADSDYGYPTVQWRKNGIPILNATNIIYPYPNYPDGDGGNVTVLTITNVQPSDAGIYDCIVYGNDWVVCPKITLSIQTTNGQGVFQSPKFIGTNFICNLAGAAGRNYQVQWSTNLTSWNNLTTLSNVTGTAVFTNGVSTNGQQFYRTVLLP